MLPILFHRNRNYPTARAWDPVAGMSRLFDLVDDQVTRGRGFNVDVCEQEDRFVIEADLPGLERDNVEITVEDGELKIVVERKEDETRKENGYHIRERHYGNATRMFSLPDQVNADAITAEMKNGVLKVALPKAEVAKPTAVTVKVE